MNAGIFCCGMILGGISVLFFLRMRLGKFREVADQILHAAEQEITKKKKAVEDELLQRQQKSGCEIDSEKALVIKEREKLEKLTQALERRERRQEEREEALARAETAVQSTLERVGKMTQQEAEEQLLAKRKRQIDAECMQYSRERKEQSAIMCATEARTLLFTAMQRVQLQQITEFACVAVPLPDAQFKAKIIGKDGRNIQHFENCTGVTLLADDAAFLRISSFDPQRREIARITLQELVKADRVTPALIEQAAQHAKRQFEHEVRRHGEAAAAQVGIDDLHPEILHALGALQYVYTLGQNVLAHSIEVAQLAKMLAKELGFNDELACRIGLLHDIGKGRPATGFDASHARAGAEFLAPYENSEVTQSVAAHHDDAAAVSPESLLCKIADSLSAQRSGARNEACDTHLKRLKNYEEIARSFTGVAAAYALQSGREIRVFVRPEELNDAATELLARDLQQKISQAKPSDARIHLTIIRQTRIALYV